ncbi:glycerol-3-phosphate dehydrogenase [Rhodovarius crocodyli]|uniref:Glycerol-3-phosphate dehydrogenase n=1 Tax=Rhodovarius crocodyli TaxID=1979269 RepID=A0A437M3M3_9PROT|nr:NAD/NADP octopine/nopaline dehydrogenase family protein [Rhodovarius crocodyli]RVT92143.1 glycerol-3-phosphate dehydrogenase [Rhodovarius crocodyli]
MGLRIAVLGGGNGCFAAAVDFSEAGHEVRLWRTSADAAAEQNAHDNIITVKDARGERAVRIAAVTAELAQAVRGAQLILCPAPATTHEALAPLLAPLLEDGQVVFLPPGTLGSVILARALHAERPGARVAFAETGTLPWLARKHGPHQVAITIRAKRLPVGVFPLNLAPMARCLLQKAFPGVIEDCGDALSGALMNAGPIIHPPLITMNAGPLEHFERWDIHNEGTQPAIRRVTDALDAERVAVREALGYHGPHFPLADHYAKTGPEWMYGRGSHDRLTDSGDWRERIVLTGHRYMLEDVRLGLSLLCDAGRAAGVPTPLASAFLAIGGAVCGADFSAARTLTGCGLPDDRGGRERILCHGF